MKKVLFLLLTVFLIVGIGGANACNAAGAYSTYFDFNNDGAADTTWDVTVGDIFSADIYFAGLGSDFGGLLAWGLQWDYDATQLNITDITRTTTFFVPLAGQPDLSTPGIASDGAGALSGVTTDPILLATVTFECLDVGTSFVEMGKIFPDKPTFSGFAAADGTVLDADIDFQAVQVTQNQVPIPGTLLLLGSGLAGFVAIRRKKRTS